MNFRLALLFLIPFILAGSCPSPKPWGEQTPCGQLDYNHTAPTWKLVH
jgi:hypothetical protein